MIETIPKGKAGNPAMRGELLKYLDQIEAAETTGKVIVHYRKGELMRAGLEVPTVMEKPE